MDSGSVYFNKKENKHFAVVDFYRKQPPFDFEFDDPEQTKDAFVKLYSIDDGSLREIKYPYFESRYTEDDDYVFKISPREGLGYVSYSGEISSPCPVCDKPLEQFYIYDHIICEHCNVSLQTTDGEPSKFCESLFKLKFFSYRDDFEFSHYFRGKTRERHQKICTDFKKRGSDVEAFWGGLFFIEKELRPNIKKRIKLIETVNVKNHLSMSGFIIELSSLIKLISTTFRRFQIPMNPQQDEKLSIILFAANHLRHLDEKDIELLGSLESYQSSGDKNLAFGLENWEYRNFLSLKSEFKMSFIGERKQVIDSLFKAVQKTTYKNAINTFVRKIINQRAKELGVEKSLKYFPWEKNLI